MKKHIIAVYSKTSHNLIGYINDKLDIVFNYRYATAFDAETTDTIIKALVAYYIVDVF